MTVLTIIIPVFNAQEFIVDTLNSVLIGITDEVEIIIVNDGSTDDSVELIKTSFSRQLKAEQFILLEQENAGVSVARNVGIEHSKGEYITFVDADDLLLKNYYSTIFATIKSVAPDIIDFGYRKFTKVDQLNASRVMFTYNDFGSLKTDDVICNVFAHSVFYSWARVIKKTVLADLRFPVGVKFCEDMIFLYQLYEQSNTIFHIEKALYGYRDNEQGATRNTKPEYLVAMLQLYQKLLTDKRPEICYLRVNIFYVIYSCSRKLGKGIYLPLNVFIDSKKLAVKFLCDGYIPARNKLILAMPNIHRGIYYLKTLCKVGK
jgi:glycosyltransferase involved in cell wall biosynthesis